MPSSTGGDEKVFYSYARKDQRLRDELDKHLSSLVRQGLISGWHDRNISAGEDWKSEIDTHMNNATIILLLISPDFIASEYCYSGEMKQALEKHEAKEAIVIPIILRPVDWEHTPFSKLQVLPINGKPVTLWRNPDQAFLNIARGIRTVVNQLQEAKTGTKTSDVLSPWGDKIEEKIALVLLDRGETLYERGNYKEALAAFDQASENDTKNIYIHLNRGDALFQLERYKEALDAYSLAIPLKHPRVHIKTGDTFFKLVAYELALAHYNNAIDLDPDNASLYAKKGDALYLLDRTENALTAYDKAIDLDPDNASFYAKKGAILVALGDYEKALIAYDQVTQLDFQNTTAHMNKGLILERLGRKHEALQSYKITRKLNSLN